METYNGPVINIGTEEKPEQYQIIIPRFSIKGVEHKAEEVAANPVLAKQLIKAAWKPKGTVERDEENFDENGVFKIVH